MLFGAGSNEVDRGTNAIDLHKFFRRYNFREKYKKSKLYVTSGTSYC